MNTLLVWENVPGQTSVYIIPDELISHRMRSQLILANNKYLGTDIDNDSMEALLEVCEAISEPSYKSKDYQGPNWHQCEIECNEYKPYILPKSTKEFYLMGFIA